jgi:hypothetical protein
MRRHTCDLRQVCRYKSLSCRYSYHAYRLKRHSLDCMYVIRIAKFNVTQTQFRCFSYFFLSVKYVFMSITLAVYFSSCSFSRGPLSLVSTIEELLERKNSDSGLEKKKREYGVEICRADHATALYPQKLILTSPTSSGCSVSIVRSRTKLRSYYLQF